MDRGAEGHDHPALVLLEQRHRLVELFAAQLPGLQAGLRGGIGRLVTEFGQKATSDPAIVYTAVIGASVLGLAMACLVALADALFMRNRPKETEA